MLDNFIFYGKINQNRGSHKCTDGAFYKEIIVYLAFAGAISTPTNSKINNNFFIKAPVKSKR